jgi:hypothetical protein
MEKILSPKRRFELQLHGTKYQREFLIDTALKTSQKFEFFDHEQYPSLEKLSNSVFTVMHLWKPINLGTRGHEGDIFSETSVRTSATRYKLPQDIFFLFVFFRLSTQQPPSYFATSSRLRAPRST